MLFAQIGIALFLKTKLKNVSFILILISLYIPDIVLLVAWIYNIMMQLTGNYVFLVNIFKVSHSFLIWSVAAVFIFLTAASLKRAKIGLVMIGGVFIHLILDIFLPTQSFSSFPIIPNISPYHFVYLYYPLTFEGGLLSIVIPDFLLWIIDFSILLAGLLYVMIKFAAEDSTIK